MQEYDPLTPGEVNDAAKEFFPLFDIVHRSMPENCTVEDTIKVMETQQPIQQDWISERSLGANFGVNVCANVGSAVVLEPINAGQPDTPLGATLPLFSGPEHNKYPVIEGTKRNQLQRQLTGSWVRALQPPSDPGGSELGANATEAADPVLQHLNSAMDLAHSPKRSNHADD